jgi:hypothetical protein
MRKGYKLADVSFLPALQTMQDLGELSLARSLFCGRLRRSGLRRLFALLLLAFSVGPLGCLLFPLQDRIVFRHISPYWRWAGCNGERPSPSAPRLASEASSRSVVYRGCGRVRTATNGSGTKARCPDRRPHYTLSTSTSHEGERGCMLPRWRETFTLGAGRGERGVRRVPKPC